MWGRGGVEKLESCCFIFLEATRAIWTAAEEMEGKHPERDLT